MLETLSSTLFNQWNCLFCAKRSVAQKKQIFGSSNQSSVFCFLDRCRVALSGEAQCAKEGKAHHMWTTELKSAQICAIRVKTFLTSVESQMVFKIFGWGHCKSVKRYGFSEQTKRSEGTLNQLNFE